MKNTYIGKQKFVNYFDQVIRHAHKIKLPRFIIDEIYEQEDFLSWDQKREMSSWLFDQFVDWYNSVL